MAKSVSQELPYHPDDDSDEDDGITQTQFVDDPEAGPLFEAKAILKEKGSKYLVDWNGLDEKGKRWKPTWEPKTNCTNQLIREWKRSQGEDEQRKKDAKKIKKDQDDADGSTAGKKRKRNTSEAASEASTVVKKPRGPTSKKAASPYAASPSQLEQLSFQPSSHASSSASSSKSTRRKSAPRRSAAKASDEEDDEEDDRSRSGSPRKVSTSSTYSKRKPFVKPKTKAAIVDSDEEIEDVDQLSQSQDAEVVGSSVESENFEREKRVRPNFKKPPTKSMSATVASDEDESEEVSPPPKKQGWPRKAVPAPSAETPSPENLPATSPLADQDVEESPESAEKLLSTVHEEDEGEEDPDQSMRGDGWGGDCGLGGNDDERVVHGFQDKEQSEAGPSTTAGNDETKEEPSQDADISRETIIPDSQEQFGANHLAQVESAPQAFEPEAAASSRPALALSVDAHSHSDELDSSLEEPAAHPSEPTSKPLRPLGDFFPSRIQVSADQDQPMSSQIEEFSSSSLEGTLTKAKGKELTVAPVKRKSKVHVNAQAGPSRHRSQQEEQLANDNDATQDTEAASSVVSIEEDEEPEEEPVLFPSQPPPGQPSPPSIIIASGTESIVSALSFSNPNPASIPATAPNSPSALANAAQPVEVIKSVTLAIRKSLDDNLLRRALSSASTVTAVSEPSAPPSRSVEASLSLAKQMLPLSAIRKQFSFSSAAEEPVTSASIIMENAVEDAALRAVEKAMNADESMDASPAAIWNSNQNLEEKRGSGNFAREEAQLSMESEVVGVEMDVDEGAVEDPLDLIRSTIVLSPSKRKAREEQLLANGEDPSDFSGLSMLQRLQNAKSNERSALALVASTQASLDDTKSALTSSLAQIQHLTARVVSAGEERDFVKQQYTESSNHAARFARELREAEELVAKLQSQLSVGLQQQQVMQDARVNKITEERDRLASQVKLLTDQSRATGDALRSKAARVPGLEKKVVEKENLAAEQEDLKEIALEELAKVQKKLHHLNKKGIAGPDPSSAWTSTSNFKRNSSSSSSASESDSDSDDDAQHLKHQQQESTDEDFGSQPFASQNFDDGSDSGDEFRPNNPPTGRSPLPSRRQSSRENGSASQPHPTSATTSAQQPNLPSSGSPKGPPPFQRPSNAGADTETDDNSDSSSDRSANVVILSSTNGDGRASQAMQVDKQNANSVAMVVEEGEEVEVGEMIRVCEWREDPAVACRAAFGTSEGLIAHAEAHGA